MPARQTSYSQYMPAAYPGMLADMSDAQIISTLNASGAAIPYGVVITNDPAHERGGVVGGAGRFLGVSVREHNGLEKDPNETSTGHMIQTLRHGAIYVKVKTAVTRGGVASYDPATGELQEGAGTPIPGITAYFRDAAPAGDFAVLLLS